jgi:Predicted lipoprotein of unknown function (DUF2380)
VLSDADPETWIPGAQYDSAFRTLRELEPNHPQLQSLSTSNWVPTFSDASRLNEEIARIKARRGLSELERHHNFPSQFASQFRACGIEPEDYLTLLPRSFHRLRPDGLHTTPINWNARWDQFLSDQPTAKPEELLKHLHGMWKNVLWMD